MAAVNLDILEKNFTSTPRRTTQAILALCDEINPGAKPFEVPVRPADQSEKDECFHNVRQIVEKEGGTLLYGWAIWEWPKVLVEAEHHAVWEKDGVFIDVTPKLNKEKRILFLPDPQRAYDFSGNIRLQNIRRVLRNSIEVKQWLGLVDQFNALCEKNRNGREVSLDPIEFSFMNESITRAKLEIICQLASETNPRDRCICSSGIEFRKCCAKLVRL